MPKGEKENGMRAVSEDHWTGPLLVPAGSQTRLMFLLIDKYIGL
jgi:hypothetical protein